MPARGRISGPVRAGVRARFGRGANPFERVRYVPAQQGREGQDLLRGGGQLPRRPPRAALVGTAGPGAGRRQGAGAGGGQGAGAAGGAPTARGGLPAGRGGSRVGGPRPGPAGALAEGARGAAGAAARGEGGRWHHGGGRGRFAKIVIG